MVYKQKVSRVWLNSRTNNNGLHVHLLDHQFVCQSISLPSSSVFPWICLLVWVSISLPSSSFCLSICQSVCQNVRMVVKPWQLNTALSDVHWCMTWCTCMFTYFKLPPCLAVWLSGKKLTVIYFLSLKLNLSELYLCLNITFELFIIL